MTIRQKQNLLQYLGYYDGKVDGINGPLTEGAVAAFRTDNGNPNMGDELEEVLIGAVFHGKFKGATDTNVGSKSESGNWWGNIKCFGRHEFACKCGKYCNGYPVEPKEKLLKAADRVREHFDAPMHVTSGVRCEQHNANTPGAASGSRHKSGKAMDFWIEGKTSAEILPYVKKQPEIRYCYAINDTCVHMDIE